MNSLDRQVISEIDSMTACLARQVNPRLYGPAPFWAALGDKHKSLIEKYGFNKFKRTINFEYHQWEVLSLKDDKILTLITSLLRAHRIPYGLAQVKIDALAVADVSKIRAVPYKVFMGLLWQYALLKDQLGCLNICEEPLLGSPLPVTYKGNLISQ